MQTLTDVAPFVIVLFYLALQTIWLLIGRFARDRYLRDIMSFRTPSSSLSRYYSWRVDHTANGILEGFVFVFILIIGIIGMGLTILTMDSVIQSTLIIIFAAFLAIVSSLQHAWRVREITDSEMRIITSIKTSSDKIGVAKRMVDELYNQGTLGDGKTWFALFKIAQRHDQIGWAIKDVLIEKGKEEHERLQRQKPSSEESTEETGPEIS